MAKILFAMEDTGTFIVPNITTRKIYHLFKKAKFFFA